MYSRFDRKSLEKSLDKILKVLDAFTDIAEGFTSWRMRPWPLAKFASRGVVLDLGAGSCVNGVYAYSLGGRYLLCIDISYRMCFISRKLLVKRGVVGDSVAGDMLFLPVRDNAVDSIIAIASIHHIPKNLVDMVFKEIKRVARDGAITVVTVWSWRQPRFILSTLANVFLKLLGLATDIREYLVPWRKRGRTVYRYYQLYTLREILQLCKKHGFEVISYGFTGYTKRRSDNIYVIAKIRKHIQHPKTQT